MIAGHPFDTIKVRLQSQIIPLHNSSIIQKAATTYHSTFQTMWRIVKEERVRDV